MDGGGPLDLAVHAVIADRRGRLLLLRHPAASDDNPGRWEFPGGRIDPGEGVRDALAREIREKTGLAVEPGRLLGAGDQERREGRVVHLVLNSTAQDGEILLSEEHDAYRWVTPKGLAELPLSDWMEGWHSSQGE
jgi:8-oxo-dGTP diphosphatase